MVLSTVNAHTETHADRGHSGSPFIPLFPFSLHRISFTLDNSPHYSASLSKFLKFLFGELAREKERERRKGSKSKVNKSK